MDKMQKASAREKMRVVRSKLVEANMWITEGEALKAFQAAEEAYMASFDFKDYLDKVVATKV